MKTARAAKGSVGRSGVPAPRRLPYRLLASMAAESVEEEEEEAAFLLRLDSIDPSWLHLLPLITRP